MNKFVKIIYFCLGLGATSPMLSLVMGGKVLSLLTIALLFVYINLLFFSNKKKFKFRKGLSQYFLGWMLVSIISTIFGFLYFLGIDTRYSFATLEFIPKILLYLLFYFLLATDSNAYGKSVYILIGIKYGIGLNLIWSIVDAIMYYTIRISLTNTVFIKYIQATNMHFGQASIIDGFSIRSVGLNNDPATIGFFSVATTVYGLVNKKNWFILLSIMASLSCVSFVGLLGSILAIVLHLFISRRYQKSMYIKKKGYPVIIIGVFIFVGGLIWFANTDNPFIDQVRTAIELRAESKIEGDNSSNIRKLFISKFPNCVAHMPTSLIIGTGYFTVVYPYYKEGLYYTKDYAPSDIENTYVDNFFSFGLIGFCIFIGFYVKLCLKARKLLYYLDSFALKIVYSIGIASLISFATYHYTLYSVVMFTSITAIIIIDNNKLLPTSKYDSYKKLYSTYKYEIK